LEDKANIVKSISNPFTVTFLSPFILIICQKGQKYQIRVFKIVPKIAKTDQESRVIGDSIRKAS
jgi:hypothetical protein